MEQVNPTVIITGSRSDEGLIEAIQRYCRSREVDSHRRERWLTVWVTGQEHDACQYHIRSYKDFALGSAVARLTNLSMLSPSMTQGGRAGSSEEDDDGRSSVHHSFAAVVEPMTDEERSRRALLTLGCFTNLEAQVAVSWGVVPSG